MKNILKVQLCFILLVLPLFTLLAQSKFDLTNNQIEFRIQSADEVVANATGTPFIHGQFAPASVDEYKQQYMVRFNATNGVLEFKDASGQILVISNEEDHVIRMQDGTERVYQTLSTTDGRVLVQRLWSDDTDNGLYVKESVGFHPAREALNSYDVNKSAAYVRLDDVFYYKVEGQATLTEVPNRKKDFLKTFEKKAIKNYLKDENIDIKEREDLIKLFGFYFNN